MTKVSNCKCEHEFQDKVYGQGKRLFNEIKEGKEIKCTVCNATKLANAPVKK